MEFVETFIPRDLGLKDTAAGPDPLCISAAEMQKPPPVRAGVLGLGSLTITYFHTGIRTIIGV
ncbi:hypothetical protein, partial [Burkholderia contaminans]|uniref:hypothetical protein n=1 Tax=Burkholderia contaminans TaxID=488447 RepID=UPI001C2E338E